MIHVICLNVQEKVHDADRLKCMASFKLSIDRFPHKFERFVACNVCVDIDPHTRRLS